MAGYSKSLLLLAAAALIEFPPGALGAPLIRGGAPVGLELLQSHPQDQPSKKPQARPRTQPKSRPQTRPGTPPQTRPRSKPPSRPQTRPQSQPGVRHQARPQTRPPTRPQTRPQTRSKPRPPRAWPAKVAPSYWHGRRYWKLDIRHFNREGLPAWRRGRWYHTSYLGRFGWWWVVAGMWYFYPFPIFPYPNPYIPGTIVVVQTRDSGSSPPPAEAPVQYWYYCAAPEGYYPYVSECPGGWTAVPAAQSAEAPATDQ